MTAASRGTLLFQLTELVEALDKRTASLAQAGEARIARDAAALRAEAEKRIMQIKAVS